MKRKDIKQLFRTRLLKTIWLNFTMLPLKQAVKLPIWLFGKTTFRSLKGKIIIKGQVFPGMIRIGKNDSYIDTSVQQCIWTINGTIIFNGRLHFGRGSYILVSDNARLEFGTNGTYFGSNLRIMCFDHIVIGDTVRVTWDCQFYDTSFHYIEQLDKDCEIKPLTSPIKVGDRVWIGNRTTISKGAVIPNDTIISSNSLVNKDFSPIEPFCMLAGCPATIKAKGLKRIFDSKKQKEMDQQFNYSRTHL